MHKALTLFTFTYIAEKIFSLSAAVQACRYLNTSTYIHAYIPGAEAKVWDRGAHSLISDCGEGPITQHRLTGQFAFSYIVASSHIFGFEVT